MAETIKCRIYTINDFPEGGANVVVRFTDAKGFSWDKGYMFKNTEEMSLDRFKTILVDDLKRDLKPKVNVTALQAQLGKDFTLSI